MTDKEEKLVEKIKKDFPEFYDSLQSAGKDELRSQLTNHAKHREEVEKAKEECVPLNEAKEKVKELNGLFAPNLKALKLRMKYLYLLMREKGDA